jgi:hypothetical protein
MYAHTEEMPIVGAPAYAPRRASTLTAPLFAAAIIAAAFGFPAAWRAAADTAPETSRARTTPGVVTSFGSRASHNGRYRAEVVSHSALGVGITMRWTIRVEHRNHRRLAHAHISARASMPETGEQSPVPTRVTHLGGSRYRIDDVYFSKPGWWNVALVVEGQAGTDSLAFNASVGR